IDPTIPGYPTYSIEASTQGANEEFNLRIQGTTLRDDANFECQVGPANGEPFLRASANLTIIVPPEFPEILGYRNGVTVDIPYTQHLINFTCLVRNARPAATIKWYRNDQLVTQGIQTFTEPIVGDKRENTRSILTIGPSSNHQQEHGAVYKCSAENTALNTPLTSQKILYYLFI
ncbi:hypothetical protein KUTeg_006247, partial [Tegillarca granosa]